MAEKIRFHLDENMDPDIAAALRQYGISITVTTEQGLRGQDNAAHLEYARAEGRVIVTDDTDFLRIASSTTDHPGIVYCRRSSHSLGQIIRHLILVHEVLEPQDIAGRVEYV